MPVTNPTRRPATGLSWLDKERPALLLGHWVTSPEPPMLLTMSCTTPGRATSALPPTISTISLARVSLGLCWRSREPSARPALLACKDLSVLLARSLARKALSVPLARSLVQPDQQDRQVR